MPAKLYDGSTSTPTKREAQAYCEGWAAGIAGALQTTNPHITDSDDYDAWDRGWVAGDAALVEGDNTERGGCADIAPAVG